MRYGTVVQYFPAKGYGFIRPDFGQDIFFHVKALGELETEPRIEIGQAVKYELVPGTEPKSRRRRKREEEEETAEEPVRPQALKVELLDKMPGGVLEQSADEKRTYHPKARRKKPTWRR
ncbi:MAG: cold shock domain-containing protein [Pirellulaceae bacterium]